MFSIAELENSATETQEVLACDDTNSPGEVTVLAHQVATKEASLLVVLHERITGSIASTIKLNSKECCEKLCKI